MASGDLTVTSTSYDTFELAVAFMNAGADPAATDYHKLFIEPGVGASRYKVVKSVREA